jgi:hypothetical protein
MSAALLAWLEKNTKKLPVGADCDIDTTSIRT